MGTLVGGLPFFVGTAGKGKADTAVMRVFVTGCRGQLGTDVLQILGPRHAVDAGDLPELDIAEPDSVRKCLGGFAPDVIVNCAAHTAVDAAEKDRAAAWRANVEGPRVLAEWAAEAGCRLVHISTDYVFDGARRPPEPYVETDATGPVCYYGTTKLEGERAVARAGGRAAVLRTAWLYGRHGRNFLKSVLRKAVARPGEALRVVNDQFGSPTWSWRLALQIEKVIDASGEGTYHATAEGCCTWYELARVFLRAMGVECRVEPCATAEYPTAARRPANSILENARLKRDGLNVMAPWAQDVREFARRHGAELLDEAKKAAT
jgi:dTDP-4-dehydrorhamnose reductase